MLGYNNNASSLINHFIGSKKNFSIKGYFHNQVENCDVPFLGPVSESLKYAIDNDIDEIYSTIPPEKDAEIYQLANAAEKELIRFKFIPDFRMFVNRNIQVEFVKGIPIVSLRPEPLEEFGSRIRKRAFDIIFSVIIIVFILSWLIPLLAIIIKVDSKGPIFFKQLRSGKNNEPFLCFKFRSLKLNKEADKEQVKKNDNRYTGIGKFLRKSSIDELPQFFNVLRGDMSVVGPRPHMLAHTAEYSRIINEYMIRHYIKPGVTGLAQISGYRGEINSSDELRGRIEYDVMYMENWSMWFDLKIILLTAYRAIAGDKKAY